MDVGHAADVPVGRYLWVVIARISVRLYEAVLRFLFPHRSTKRA